MGLLDITPVTLKDMDNAAARIHADLSTVQEGLRQLFCREEAPALRARVAELEAALKPFAKWYEKHVSCDITFVEAKNKLCERYFIDAAQTLKGGE